MDQFAIREICYTTAEEVDRSRRATDECRDNNNLPEQHMFEPAAYYRLDVTTEVTGELNLDNLPFSQNSVIGKMLSDAYQAVLGEVTVPQTYTQASFFQTKTPPTNLRPYVKWSSPRHQFETHYRRSFIATRFLRPNLQQMFNPPFAIKAQLRDTDGNIIAGTTEWTHAGTSTLFPEESVWEAHRNSIDWPERQTQLDDVLIFEVPGEAVLLPSSRYQFEIVGNEGNDEWNKLVLFSSAFTTSKFDSFEGLANSYRRQKSAVAKSDIQSQSNLIADLQLSCRHLAKAQWHWEHAEVDFRFQTLNEGRQGLETVRLAKREAAAAHEEKFRAVADTLADLYFLPFSENLEIYLIRHSTTRTVSALWIRSPETLQVRLPVFESPDAPESQLLDDIGRTEIKLERIAPTGRNIAIAVLPNSDSTQVLVLPASGQSWDGGTYSLNATYYRDHRDETKHMDHRYDRPIELSATGSGPVVHFWKWRV